MTWRRARHARVAAAVAVIAVAGSGIASHAAHRDGALEGDVVAGPPPAPVEQTATTTGPAPSATMITTTAPPHDDGNEMARRPSTGAATPPVAAARDASRPPATSGGGPGPSSPGSSAGAAATAGPAEALAAPTEKHCVVTLHGKGGAGSAPRVNGAVTELAPPGNAAGWGGRQWRYDDASSFAQARAIVRDTVDGAGCTGVVVHGFSNGAAFAAKLYCRGESLGGRLVRVIVDDPVTDAGPVGCGPAGGVAVTLYWTGALAATAPAGWSCAAADWTCEGGTSIGIDAYAAALGTAPRTSPMGGHAMYVSAPERTRF